MPEGHTIHRVAEDHNKWFAGQTLKATSPQGRFTDGAKILNGKLLSRVHAHGKHLFYEWGNSTLHIHLGLYGKFRRHKTPPPEPRGAVRLRVVGEDRAFDLNGPTACELLSGTEFQKLRSRLGEDPLRDDADPEIAWQKISRSRSAIGQLLLNQSVIAGVGNVYRAEILFLLRLHPSIRGNELTRSEFDDIWELTVRLLKIGKRYNKIIITNPDDVGKPRSKMNSSERLLIYKKPHCTVCETAVDVWQLASRKIYACPVCQPERV